MNRFESIADLHPYDFCLKVRTRTQDIPSKSADCVISIDTVSKSEFPVETVQEAFRFVTIECHHSVRDAHSFESRILRPGGLFVFVEADGGNDIIDKITKVKLLCFMTGHPVLMYQFSRLFSGLS